MEHLVFGAILFGLSISEWLGILALGGTVIGTLFTLMKKNSSHAHRQRATSTFKNN